MSQYSLKEPVYQEFGYKYNTLTPKFEANTHVGLTSSGQFLDSIPLNINSDATLLFQAYNRVTPVAIRVYTALLMRLISNDKPVRATVNELRCDIGLTPKSKRVDDAIHELERERLILRQKQNYKDIYINPLFAWTGDRMQYFDPSTLPLLPEED